METPISASTIETKAIIKYYYLKYNYKELKKRDVFYQINYSKFVLFVIIVFWPLGDHSGKFFELCAAAATKIPRTARKPPE